MRTYAQLDRLNSKLRNKGLLIGRGAYSDVFQHPNFPDRVIKITRHSDPGALSFLLACYNGELKGLCFPKIYHLHAIVEDVDGRGYQRFYFICVLERLKKLNCSRNYRTGNLIVHDGSYSGRRFRKLRDKLLSVTLFAAFLKRVMKHGPIVNDLHNGNVMLRSLPTGRNYYVITDPVA